MFTIVIDEAISFIILIVLWNLERVQVQLGLMFFPKFLLDELGCRHLVFIGLKPKFTATEKVLHVFSILKTIVKYT